MTPFDVQIRMGDDLRVVVNKYLLEMIVAMTAAGEDDSRAPFEALSMVLLLLLWDYMKARAINGAPAEALKRLFQMEVTRISAALLYVDDGSRREGDAAMMTLQERVDAALKQARRNGFYTCCDAVHAEIVATDLLDCDADFAGEDFDAVAVCCRNNLAGLSL